MLRPGGSRPPSAVSPLVLALVRTPTDRARSDQIAVSKLIHRQSLFNPPSLRSLRPAGGQPRAHAPNRSACGFVRWSELAIPVHSEAGADLVDRGILDKLLARPHKLADLESLVHDTSSCSAGVVLLRGCAHLLNNRMAVLNVPNSEGQCLGPAAGVSRPSGFTAPEMIELNRKVRCCRTGRQRHWPCHGAWRQPQPRAATEPQPTTKWK